LFFPTFSACTGCVITQLLPDLTEVLADWTLLVLFLVELRYHARQKEQTPSPQQQQQQAHQHHQHHQKEQQRQRSEEAGGAGQAAVPPLQGLMQQQAELFAKWLPYYDLLPERTGCLLEWPPEEVRGGKQLQQEAANQL
jgi:hypothetical protein